MVRLFLVYPTARPEQIADAVSRALEAAHNDVYILVGYEGENQHFSDTANVHYLWTGERGQGPEFIPLTNQLYRDLCERFSVRPEELVGFWADDFYPAQNWDIPLLAAAAHPMPRLYQPNDRIQPSGACATIPFATRSWWDDYNGRCIWPPIYQRFSCDDDIAYRAQICRQYQYVPECVIEHRHPAAKTRPEDWLDQKGQRHYFADKRMFERRRKAQIDRGEYVTWQ